MMGIRAGGRSSLAPPFTPLPSPATRTAANTLAKVANGLCDNLLTCVVRAWDWGNKPVLLAPAMNTLMWDSPFTEQHLAVCRRLGAEASGECMGGGSGGGGVVGAAGFWMWWG